LPLVDGLTELYKITIVTDADYFYISAERSLTTDATGNFYSHTKRPEYFYGLLGYFFGGNIFH